MPAISLIRTQPPVRVRSIRSLKAIRCESHRYASSLARSRSLSPSLCLSLALQALFLPNEVSISFYVDAVKKKKKKVQQKKKTPQYKECRAGNGLCVSRLEIRWWRYWHVAAGTLCYVRRRRANRSQVDSRQIPTALFFFFFSQCCHCFKTYTTSVALTETLPSKQKITKQ